MWVVADLGESKTYKKWSESQTTSSLGYNKKKGRCNFSLDENIPKNVAEKNCNSGLRYEDHNTKLEMAD